MGIGMGMQSLPPIPSGRRSVSGCCLSLWSMIAPHMLNAWQEASVLHEEVFCGPSSDFEHVSECCWITPNWMTGCTKIACVSPEFAGQHLDLAAGVNGNQLELEASKIPRRWERLTSKAHQCVSMELHDEEPGVCPLKIVLPVQAL